MRLNNTSDHTYTFLPRLLDTILIRIRYVDVVVMRSNRTWLFIYSVDKALCAQVSHGANDSEDSYAADHPRSWTPKCSLNEKNRPCLSWFAATYIGGACKWDDPATTYASSQHPSQRYRQSVDDTGIKGEFGKSSMRSLRSRSCHRQYSSFDN